MHNAKVTVITATTGNPKLHDCLISVANQTHKNVEHLVFIDGPDRTGAANKQFDEALDVEWADVERTLKVIQLPYSVGKDRWNGHRIYAAGSYLADGDFVMFLDDDNTIDKTHIDLCLNAMHGNDWVFSFRKIVDKDGKYLCDDDCESLGNWASVLHPQDYFVDVNCFFMHRKLAVGISPLWFRKFREPGQPEVDRVLTSALRGNGLKFAPTYGYTVNYTVGNTENSVQKEFFEQGNAKMMKTYKGKLPWKVHE
jgi:glycosyltransferase involved in cell wall biosynthesis